MQTKIHLQLDGTEYTDAQHVHAAGQHLIAVQLDSACLFLNDRAQALALASAIESAAMRWADAAGDTHPRITPSEIAQQNAAEVA